MVVVGDSKIRGRVLARARRESQTRRRLEKATTKKGIRGKVVNAWERQHPRSTLRSYCKWLRTCGGHLPEKERERLRQLSADQVVPGHDLAIEKYFRRLADESRREETEQ